MVCREEKLNCREATRVIMVTEKDHRPLIASMFFLIRLTVICLELLTRTDHKWEYLP